MPLAPIPINVKSRSDIDPTMDASECMGLKRNFLVDEKGRLVKRPLLALFANKYEFGGVNDYVTGLETSIGASLENRSSVLHYASFNNTFSEIQYSLAQYDGISWAVTDYNAIANITTSPLESFARTIFLPGLAFSVTNTVVVVHPNAPSFLYFDSSTTGSEITPASLAGDGIRGAAIMNRRLLLGRGNTEEVYYSNVNDLTTWDAIDFFSGELTTDGISSLYVSRDQLYVIGGRSLEVWRNDGVNPFSRIPGATFTGGNEIKYGPVAHTEEGVFMYSGAGELYFSDGRAPQRIASGVTSDLYDYGFSTTIFGHSYDHFRFHQKDYLYLRMSDGKAIFIDIANDDYSVIDKGTGDILSSGTEWNVTGVRSGMLNNQLFIGAKDQGLIASLRCDKGTAYDDSEIVSSFKTGWVNRGTDSCKVCKRITIKAYHTTDGGTPSLTIKYYNNGNTAVVASHTIDLSDAYNTMSFFRLHNLGQYRFRQWEITTSSRECVIIGGIEEEFEVLDR